MAKKIADQREKVLNIIAQQIFFSVKVMEYSDVLVKSRSMQSEHVWTQV